jgi:hypothetical protein
MFGFADDSPRDKESKWSIFESIRHREDEEIRPGRRVVSMLTETSGVISDVDQYNGIHIDWDNGNKSRASKMDLTTVVLVDEVV